ncbi:MAG: DUF177 domain-containing protein [Candidatus Zixiibacteriota bacterium]|nr:MAG: DUF177 domain-containing protein [candidate division Zixibacteria bacterium]
MNFDLREFNSFPIDLSLESEADPLEGAVEGVSFRDVVKMRINLQKVKEEYYCHGLVSAQIEVECSRCLEMFKTELATEMECVIKTGEGKPVLSSGVMEECIYLKQNEHVVDLTDVVRQALTLALPLKPVCREECRGLCPNCGVNLNEEECDCSEDEIDERWEGLRNLLE